MYDQGDMELSDTDYTAQDRTGRHKSGFKQLISFKWLEILREVLKKNQYCI